MATRDQLLQALRAADAAGNKADAAQLARSIQALDATPQRGALEETGRTVGQFGHGFNDSLAATLGAVPDAMNWAARASGLYPALGLKTTPWGFYPEKIKQGIESVVPPPPPAEGWLEKGAYGAGQGVGDAAAIAIPAAAVARTARVGGMTGRIAGELAAQPATQAVAGAAGGAVGEATDNPYLGLAAALATPLAAGGVRRLISPVPSRLTPEQTRLVGVAQQEGIPLRPGQLTGSKPLQTMESVLDNLPLSGGMGQRELRGTQDAYNAAILRRAGITGTSATPDVIDAAHVRLGHEFERLSANTTVQLDRPLLNDLHNTVDEYQRNLNSDQRQIFANHVRDIWLQVQQPGGMAGATYQKARSTLGRLQKSLATSDPELSRAFGGLQSAIDDAAGRNIPAPLRDAWQTARSQYRNLLAIDKTVSSASAGSAAGDISAAQLWPAIRQQTGTAGMARGRGDLNDLARVGQAFVKPQIPDSGTPARTAITKMLTGGLPLAGALMGGAPGAAVGVGVAGAGLLTPPIVKAAMSSPWGRRWLINQAATGVGPRITPGLLGAIGLGREKNSLLSAP